MLHISVAQWGFSQCQAIAMLLDCRFFGTLSHFQLQLHAEHYEITIVLATTGCHQPNVGEFVKWQMNLINRPATLADKQRRHLTNKEFFSEKQNKKCI